jgi:hypothetical protein
MRASHIAARAKERKVGLERKGLMKRVKAAR